mmetsp:Transcript_93899/g.201570  ORF Transcript_93899/g.201570 Transcript_93899/m.201570 type:complete len:143 (-) Transcript_93899:159-587(-)
MDVDCGQLPPAAWGVPAVERPAHGGYPDPAGWGPWAQPWYAAAAGASAAAAVAAAEAAGAAQRQQAAKRPCPGLSSELEAVAVTSSWLARGPQILSFESEMLAPPALKRLCLEFPLGLPKAKRHLSDMLEPQSKRRAFQFGE